MRTLITIWMLLLATLSFGQWNWPVQTNTFMEPFANNYLSYFSDQNNHLQVLVTLTDQNATSVPAKLRIRMQGNGWWIETKPEPNSIPALELEPFVSNIITGIDLQPYFFESNLIKSSASLDLNNLPEGQIELCVEVYGIGGTLTTIGGNQCTYFNIERLQPPQFFPFDCGTTLDTNLMFHTFQWTPATGFTPLIGADIEYTYSLYEVIDPNNYAIQVSNQIGLIEQITTPLQIVQIDLFNLNLQVGKKYIWQVRAVVYDNGIPRQMVDNDGFSGICEFNFGEAQSLEEILVDGLEIILSAQANTQYKGTANWTVTDNTPNEGLSTYEKYLVEYRLQPDAQHPNPTWHYDTVIALSKLIYQLAPETTYEVRVSGMAGSFTSDPTPIVSFTTPAAVDYVCGDQQIPFRPNQYTPNDHIQVGDQVQIGQFLMNITEAIPQYEPGRYAGQGWIPVEFLGGARANVEFDNILIDNEYVVRDGRVDVTTDGVAAWLEEQLQDFVQPIYVNGTIDSAWVDTTTNTAWVIVDGQSIPFTFDPPDYPIVIHDDSGMSWTIWPNGTITVEGYLDPSNDFLDVSADSVAVFAQNSGEVFGFDAKEHMAWHENYEIIQLPDNTYYFVPNKSIGKNESDVVDVTIPFSGTPTFKLDDQTTINYSLSGGGVGGGQSTQSYTVTIPPISSQGRHEIYVYNDQNQRVGKLNVHVYSQKDRELVVVPVTNTTVDAAQLKATLDQTLKEANLNVSVTVASQWNNAQFTPTTSIALPQNLTVMTDYSQDMRDLRDAYFNDTSNQKNNNAYYLFVVPEFDDPSTDGYMVQGKALGFVKGNDYQVYAHELAHGMGGLEHSWKFGGPDQGTTNNLMDYNPNGGNTNLTKAQWKELRDWDLAPSMWDDVEDAMYQWEEYMVFYENEPTWTYIEEKHRDKAFFLLNGYPYKFDQTIGKRVQHVIFDKFGRVFGFQTEDLIQYEAAITLITSTDQPVSRGYLPVDSLSNWWHRKDPNHTYVTASQEEYMDLYGYEFSMPLTSDSVFSKSVIWIHNGQSHPNDRIEVYEGCQAERTVAIEIPPYAPINESALVKLPPGFKNSEYNIVDGGNECQISDAVFSMSQGCGAQIYYKLRNKAPNEEDLIELADYFSTNGANFLYTFYDFPSNTYEFIGVNDQGMLYDDLTLIPKVFDSLNIYSLAKFEQKFPRSNWFQARGKDSVISQVNIWTNPAAPIEPWYNAASIDYTTYDIPSFKDWTPFDVNQLIELVDYIDTLYQTIASAHPDYAQTPNMVNTGLWIQNCRADYFLAMEQKLALRHNVIAILNTLGAFDKYHYSMYDLVEREKLRRAGGPIWTAVLNAEADGLGQPINMLEAYYQYVNKYNTESAFFLGLEYMKMFVENFFEPVALLKVIQKAQAIRGLFKSHRAARPRNLDDIFRGINAVTKRSAKLPKKMYDLHKRLEYAGVDFVDGVDEIIYKTKNGDEFARINSNNEFIITHPKGSRPLPNTYLDQSYIDAHVSSFNQQGGAFVIRKSDLNNLNYSTMPDRKFIGLKSEMDVVINKYNSSNQNVSILEDELNLGSDYFKPNDEVYYVVVEPNSNFQFDIPNGNEGGAYEGFWVPGGYTKNGTKEAVLSNSGNFYHNNDWSTFENFFGPNNVIRIK